MTKLNTNENTNENPWTRDYLLDQCDRLASALRSTVASYLETGRDDPQELRRLSGLMLCDSRSLSAYLGDIARIDHAERNRMMR